MQVPNPTVPASTFFGSMSRLEMVLHGQLLALQLGQIDIDQAIEALGMAGVGAVEALQLLTDAPVDEMFPLEYVEVATK